VTNETTLSPVFIYTHPRLLYFYNPAIPPPFLVDDVDERGNKGDFGKTGEHTILYRSFWNKKKDNARTGVFALHFLENPCEWQS
jgi:hypothetical protein